MSELWLPLSEESDLPEFWSEEAKERLLKIYDPLDPSSVWRRALEVFGFRVDPAISPLICWRGQRVYVRYSALIQSLSCSTLETVVAPGDTGSERWTIRSRGPWKLFQGIYALLRAQWRIENYLAKRLGPLAELPREIEEQILESTVLGLATIALTMRLPRHRPDEFARWLAVPLQAPVRVRRTIQVILRIQSRRTLLSGAWKALFPEAVNGLSANKSDSPSSVLSGELPKLWQGLPVSPGMARGQARRGGVPSEDEGRQWILVFPRATPETVESFSAALAVIYLQGGVLSHACTVARERGIPCVTAVDKTLLQALDVRLDTWLEVDGDAGTVSAYSPEAIP